MSWVEKVETLQNMLMSHVTGGLCHVNLVRTQTFIQTARITRLSSSGTVDRPGKRHSLALAPSVLITSFEQDARGACGKVRGFSKTIIGLIL